AVARACGPHQTPPAERRLLEHRGEALARLEALPAEDRDEVRAVLATLTTGMLFDLARFPGEDTASLAALDTLDELDRYTYLVAGCVGPFWTALCVAHRPRLRRWDPRAKSRAGVSFGKALQTTNVLRDVPRDLRHGRCYLPAADLAARPDPLAVTAPSKLPRGAVRALLTRSAFAVWSDTTLAAEAARVRRRIAL